MGTKLEMNDYNEQFWLLAQTRAELFRAIFLELFKKQASLAKIVISQLKCGGYICFN